MLVMRGLMSETLAFTREVGRGSKVHIEGLILCMIPTSSLTVVTKTVRDSLLALLKASQGLSWW